MGTALYPGSFDPITFGHIDIARRASRIFSRVVTVVASNPGKNPIFSVEERIDMVRQSLRDVPNIEVVSFSGLIVNCVKQYDASVIIRGLRALTDFEYEFQMAYTNRQLYEPAETVFLMPSAKYTYLTSSIVRQIARLGGDISTFAPEYVCQQLAEKFKGAPLIPGEEA